jgi:hypothetical protein
MPDRRRHRGPDTGDPLRFAADRLPVLRTAVHELAWLLARGYGDRSALQLVGDHHQLDRRQRQAVRRATCTEAQRRARRARLLRPAELVGARLLIDGFNVLTTVEAALAGGVLLACADGCLRDLASVHGTWRSVDETPTAARRIGDLLARWRVGAAVWLLDRPVGNSGRLAAALRTLATVQRFAWQVEVVDDPDRQLAAATDPIATADSVILDRGGRWIDLARRAVAGVPGAWMLDLA